MWFESTGARSESNLLNTRKMKDIDLTKCNNCRAKVRARYRDGEEYVATGRIFILSDDAVFMECDDNEEGDLELFYDGRISDEIVDFEIVPRNPETYMDWQVGDVIRRSNWSGYNGRIVFRSGEFVAADIDGCVCYTCQELFDEGYRLVLTDIEEQIIGEKKKYAPQDGDIVAWKDMEDDGDSAVSIYKAKDLSYMTLFTNGDCYAPDFTLAMNILRPATEEERQRLFDAMAERGKRWNAEKKVVDNIPKPHEFRPGEPVLVRDYDDNIWKLAAFRQRSGNASYPYEIRNERGNCYNHRKCIPYNERTMHLLGTTEDYKEGE